LKEKVEKAAPMSSYEDPFYDDPFFVDPNILEPYDEYNPKYFMDRCKSPLPATYAKSNTKENDINDRLDDIGSDLFTFTPKTSTAATTSGSNSFIRPRGGKPSQPLQPPQLLPDENWSVEDCYLLKEIEAKFERTKWLQVQADFYNWSGRMVDASLIQGKFQKDGLY
jgi:hypothetical protein